MKFIFIIIFLVLFSSLISAHSTIIFHNTLDINDDSVLFSNDGSLTEVGDDYQAYIIKNIIIKNDDVPCSFGDFNYDIDPIDGFNVLVSCNSKINNLSINDSTLSGTFNVNKVYEVNVGNSKKRFVGEDIYHLGVASQIPVASIGQDISNLFKDLNIPENQVADWVRGWAIQRGIMTIAPTLTKYSGNLTF